jgi:hypothetical protein
MLLTRREQWRHRKFELWRRMWLRLWKWYTRERSKYQGEDRLFNQQRQLYRTWNQLEH